ncbi:hypothetical protein CANCADRAFT_18138, partial [Tortispora caseinolytica NRRL Y-17796]
GRVVEQNGYRLLLVADARGNLDQLNDLAAEHKVDCIFHSGDFGFFDRNSVGRISDNTLRHLAQYSPLVDFKSLPHDSSDLRSVLSSQSTSAAAAAAGSTPLSHFPAYISGHKKFKVPIYTVWGACEDIEVLEQIRRKDIVIENLHIVDEASTYLIETNQGVKLRVFGVGGAVVMHKLFDNGVGTSTIAGGQGTMWVTMIQLGRLIQTASSVFDPSETRIFLSHASTARDGILAQIALTLKADFTVSAGLHFRCGTSYNEFSVNPSLNHFRSKLAAAHAQFNDVWSTVKDEVIQILQADPIQKALLGTALSVVDKMPWVDDVPSVEGDEAISVGFKNQWNFNLSDIQIGSLILEVVDGRIGMEMKSKGFSFSYR